MEDLERMDEVIERLRVKLKTLDLDEKVRTLWERSLDHMIMMKETLSELEELLYETHT